MIKDYMSEGERLRPISCDEPRAALYCSGVPDMRSRLAVQKFSRADEHKKCPVDILISLLKMTAMAAASVPNSQWWWVSFLTINVEL